MRFRRFELIPLLFITGSVILLVGLGTWQLQRLQWKNSQIARIEQAQAEPALGSLPELPGQEAVDALAFHKVRLTGTFLHDKTLHVVGRPKQAGSVQGFFLMTPFRLEDDGRIILVNRGFSPPGKDIKPQDTQTIEGVIRPAHRKRYFSPDNHPEKNVWFYDDIAAMSLAIGTQLTPVIVEITGKAQKGIYPMPHDGRFNLRNDHLHYAITWFSLAIIGIIMFIIYYRKPRQDT